MVDLIDDAIDTATDVGGGAVDVTAGATDSVLDFGADAGNALLGVETKNQGIFAPDKAGGKAVFIGTAGLGGEGGIFTDLLVPDSGGSEGQDGGQNRPEQEDRTVAGLPPTVAIGGGLALLLLLVVLGGGD